jgi:hypothetical protein
MTDGLKPNLGKVDLIYLDHVSREINKAVVELFEKIEEATIVRIVERTGKVSVGTYRRRRRPLRIQAGKVIKGDFYMGPNRWKRIDQKIKRLDFVSENGDLLGVIWNFACHPVSHPGIYQVSAHYPGEVRSALRRLNKDLPVLFLQGFAGDIRPKSISGFGEHPFRTLKNGPEFRLFSRTEYLKFCRKISKAVVSAKTIKVSSEVPNKKSLSIIHESEMYIRDSKTSDVRIQIVPLGNVYLLGISAEPSDDAFLNFNFNDQSNLAEQMKKMQEQLNQLMQKQQDNSQPEENRKLLQESKEELEKAKEELKKAKEELQKTKSTLKTQKA